ncbi:hypothetical protein [Pseudovibrio sp. Tun.PSC04-5.I4]|uniref:hypothetical protein n=1 Tax=Pseudovibrio sp. Tun.PSC04-5.I4 TaxID=1798213 RepID=UPI0008833808|nr:hypothetical protein [Pseudovibrio sp. Tun.PSC04-5.I4]SDR11239.1 hypothetical protein SAMN04515695_2829 [Pseudovibrio sp. Tun.PSC04-5.I4]SDR34874.1 hypothetical protein SAMN04515695_4789 [Pseudovibrio sp. Tun.PSC04-5.I4]
MRLETEVNPIHIGISLTSKPEALAEVLSAIAVNAPSGLAKQVNEHMPDALRDRTSNLLEKLLIAIST